ncbi:hypothetical protein K502DRAFT_355560 [Neoconidiobolus thromboides FSU 785]|nr:hypothetical protein K502DRAFT_355560 [Neoconidiobolus thromboides FSU 785]
MQVKYSDVESNVLVHRGFYKAILDTENRSEKAVLALLKNQNIRIINFKPLVFL